MSQRLTSGNQALGAAEKSEIGGSQSYHQDLQRVNGTLLRYLFQIDGLFRFITQLNLFNIGFGIKLLRKSVDGHRRQD